MAAHCDTRTGKIYGCKKGTLTYYHEEGHIKYSQSQEGSTNQMYQTSLVMFWMLSVTIAIFYPTYLSKFFVAFFIMLFAGFGFIEEMVCWIYAFNKIKGRKKK